MSTNEYHRLALLQYVRMQHNLEEVQTALSEVEELKQQIAARHKKHRRCDKEIEKPFNVLLYFMPVRPLLRHLRHRRGPKAAPETQAQGEPVREKARGDDGAFQRGGQGKHRAQLLSCILNTQMI